jgi:hypothetical protein
MKTIFGLFERYGDAKRITSELLDLGFDEKDINVLVRDDVAKGDMQVDLEKVRTQATQEIGEKTVRGLAAVLGREVPVEVPVLGGLYAAGDLATIVIQVATGGPKGLEQGLIDLGLSEDVSESYRVAIEKGSLLLWMRSDDERAAQVMRIVREGAEQVIAHDD